MDYQPREIRFHLIFIDNEMLRFYKLNIVCTESHELILVSSYYMYVSVCMYVFKKFNSNSCRPFLHRLLHRETQNHHCHHCRYHHLLLHHPLHFHLVQFYLKRFHFSKSKFLTPSFAGGS